MATFADIRGQEPALTLLRQALAVGRRAHAYLFLGPAGVGKALTANALATAINCPVAPDQGCGRCVSCQKIAQQIHPDLAVIRPDGSMIKVDQIRALNAQLAFAPFEGRMRVVIIDGAEQLNPHAANALLKAVEEPRPHTLFVLIASVAQQVMPTLISRCQRVFFRPLCPTDLAALLATLAPDVSAQERSLAGHCAAGSVGRALERISGGGSQRATAALHRLTDAAQRATATDLFAAAAQLSADRSALAGMLELLQVTLRDRLLRAVPSPVAGAEDRAPPPADPALSWRPIVAQLRAVGEAQAALRGNVHAALTLEHLMLRLRQTGMVQRVAQPDTSSRAGERRAAGADAPP